MAFERDEVEFLGGVRHGVTQGGPDRDPRRQHGVAEVVDRHGRRPGRPGRSSRAWPATRPLTRPRPGHADLVGMQKYGFDDARPVLERASARETAARVALGDGREGAPAAGVRRRGPQPRRQHRRGRGRPVDGAAASGGPRDDRREPRARLRQRRQRRAWSPRSTRRKKEGDTLGGVVEVLAYGLPPGLGSHVHWDRRLDSRLAAALMGIQAIKGVEVGDGFLSARLRGSQVMDEIVRGEDGLTRSKRHASAAPRAACPAARCCACGPR